jgi:hypothetical protein
LISETPSVSAAFSAGPDVSMTHCAPSALAWRATRAKKSSGTPGGTLPLATTNFGRCRSVVSF